MGREVELLGELGIGVIAVLIAERDDTELVGCSVFESHECIGRSVLAELDGDLVAFEIELVAARVRNGFPLNGNRARRTSVHGQRGRVKLNLRRRFDRGCAGGSARLFVAFGGERENVVRAGF